MAIGLFSGNPENLDPKNCLDRGISIFQPKDTNQQNIAELALAGIILFQQKIPPFLKTTTCHNFQPLTQNNLTVSGKKLGILGYGRVGSQLSVLAEQLGMDVSFFDIEKKSPIGRARRSPDMNRLLRESDFISIHINKQFGTDPIIGENELQLMRQETLLLNFSHGNAVNLSALKNGLSTGDIQGAALGVDISHGSEYFRQLSEQFSTIPNMLLLPLSDKKPAGQPATSTDCVPAQIIDYINTGDTVFSTNFPGLKLPALQDAHRLIHIHQNVPGMLAHINDILAANSINIVGQYLKTNKRIGYVITDISKEYEPAVIEELRKTPHTIKFRILY